MPLMANLPLGTFTVFHFLIFFPFLRTVTLFLFLVYFFETVAILLFDDFCFFPFFTFTVIVCPTRTLLCEEMVLACAGLTDEVITLPATASAARKENVFLKLFFFIVFYSFLLFLMA
jgi:hypothetical protein